MMRNCDVVELSQPPAGKLVQHLPLERNRSDHVVEDRDAIRGHQSQTISRKPEYVANLAGHATPSGRLGDLVDRLIQGGYDELLWRHTGLAPRSLTFPPYRGSRLK